MSAEFDALKAKVEKLIALLKNPPPPPPPDPSPAEITALSAEIDAAFPPG